MKDQVYEIFRQCFPQFPIPKDIFFKLLNADDCKFILRSENGAAAGCSVIHKNCIRLLCVRPEYRGKGLGNSLLRESESFIAENGFDRAVLGGQDSELFIGAVTPEEQWDGLHNKFFEREGYRASSGCIEMKMSLRDFDLNKLDIPPCTDNVSFGYIGAEDKEELCRAVSAVSPDWVQYFTFESPVLAAKLDSRIVGFCIVDENAETVISSGSNNVASIGCVGVIPEMRKHGVGLAMVAEAVRDVSQKGCSDAFIHYTYLEQWYGRLGFRTFLRLWFGEKELDRK